MLSILYALSFNLDEVDTVINSILEKRKLRYRELVELAQLLRASE